MAEGSIRFFTDLATAGFESGAKRMQNVAQSASDRIRASFNGVGASIARIVAPIVTVYTAINSVKNALDFGGRMADLSKTTGETAGNLAILERAFQNAGVGGERMGMAIASMSNFITDFQKGSKTASETMDRLGISMADLAGKSPIERMQVFMSAIAGIRDPALRTALAMDVFKKAGKEIVPLASNFSGELANARAELGSAPRLLTQYGESLDELGDKLSNAVGNKLNELALGLVAGASGANDFASALAKIDAAGLGEKVGNALRVAFAAPREALQGLGDFLISGILKAGNLLIAYFKYALEIFQHMFSDPGYWSGIFDRVMGGLAKLGEKFALLVLDGLQSALRALSDVPYLGGFAKAAAESLEGIKQGIIDAGIAAQNTFEDAATKIQAAFNNAEKKSQFIYEDTLNAAAYSESASKHWDNAKAAAAAIKSDSAETAANFNMGSKFIKDAMNSIRGFDLSGGPEVKKPDWYKGNTPPPEPEDKKKRAAKEEEVLTKNQRVAQIRGEFLTRSAEERAQELAGQGRGRSAVNIMDRAQAQRDRIMQRANMRDILREQFSGATDMGQAYREHQRNTSLADRMTRAEFEKSIKDQAKTPEMREREEKKEKERRAGASGAQGKSPLENVASEILGEIKKRLPIVALGY